MYVFGNDKKMRGCFHAFDLVKVTGARLQMPSGMYPSANTDPYMITGFSFAATEKYHLVQCFNDTVYTYAFGHDPARSLIEVNLVAFLTAKSGTAVSTAMETLIQGYAGTDRLSQSLGYGMFTVGSLVLLGFPVGIKTGTMDPHFNLQNFTFTLLAVEVQI